MRPEGCLGPFAGGHHDLLVSNVGYISGCKNAGCASFSLAVDNDLSCFIYIQGVHDKTGVGKQADFHKNPGYVQTGFRTIGPVFNPHPLHLILAEYFKSYMTF